MLFRTSWEYEEKKKQHDSTQQTWYPQHPCLSFGSSLIQREAWRHHSCLLSINIPVPPASSVERYNFDFFSYPLAFFFLQFGFFLRGKEGRVIRGKRGMLLNYFLWEED